MSQQLIKIIQITDTHCFANDEAVLNWGSIPVKPNLQLQSVLERLSVEKFHGLVLTGDLAQEEVPETYRRLNEMVHHFPVPIFSVPGNHDAPEVLEKYFTVTKDSKHEVFGKWHLIFLNTHKALSPGGHLTKGELKFLKTGLETVADNESVVIFMHHHPIEIESMWMDRWILDNKEEFWKVLEPFKNVKGIFHGHIHQEFEGQHTLEGDKKIQVYGTPSTCIQFRPHSKVKEIDHAIPAWREILLYESGELETKVKYL